MFEARLRALVMEGELALRLPTGGFSLVWRRDRGSLVRDLLAREEAQLARSDAHRASGCAGRASAWAFRARVAEQEGLVLRLKENDHCTDVAQDLLSSFEETLRQHEFFKAQLKAAP